MSKKNQTGLNFIFLAIAVVFSVYVYFKGKESKAELKKSGIETIGIIERYSINHKGYCMTFYHFEAAGRLITGSTYLAPWSCEDQTHIGEKYKVIFLPENPEVNKIYFDNKK